MSVSSIENDAKDNKVCPANAPGWQTLLMWGVIIALVIAAVLMRLYKLDAPFDRDGYDEGVYWQSLRAMSAGHALYQSIFYSQPPFFLLSTFPGYAFFGSTLWSARLGIALVSLFGLLGAFLLGKALGGRLGAVTALLLLITNPVYLAESQTIQAEASSTAFSLLAVGLAYMWWEQPEGTAGVCWAALTGITVSLAIMCKLLSVTCLVPIVLLMLARIWQGLRKRIGARNMPVVSIVAGIAGCILTALLLLLPFLNSYQTLISTVISFHTKAAATFASSQRGNFSLIQDALISWLSLAALFGIAASFIRKDWRVLPLIAWLLATIYLLWRQVPLFQHHLIALIPPLLGLAVVGIGKSLAWETLARYYTIFTRSGRITTEKRRASDPPAFIENSLPWIALLLIGITVVLAIRQDREYYRNVAYVATDQQTQQELHVAADLQHAITPNQLVITDAQFIAGLADRNTLPSLVDTSTVRIESGYLTVAQLENAASQPQVHAVLFYTGRLGEGETAPFHAWVAQHFRLLHNYGGGRELWVR
jgi:4-amino-4-deoxy-L-arabinose transferase-like glycosyltransferase